MEIIALNVSGYESNCYIVHNGTDAYVIDPSTSIKSITRTLGENNLNLLGILLTHGHFDHIISADSLRDATGAPLFVHEFDAEMLTDSQKNGYALFFGGNFVIREAEHTFRDGDLIPLGDEQIKVIHTPGHSRGSVCFDLGDAIITGDTLFAQGFGRYDLYGASLESLRESISKLTTLAQGERKWLFSGHGESSTLSQAIKYTNYFF